MVTKHSWYNPCPYPEFDSAISFLKYIRQDSKIWTVVSQIWEVLKFAEVLVTLVISSSMMKEYTNIDTGFFIFKTNYTIYGIRTLLGLLIIP